MKNVNCIALSAVDTASVNGAAIDSSQLVSASFQPVFGDVTAAGTVKIQASNDINNTGYNNNFVPTNWSDITSATSTIASGVGPIIMIANLSYQWIRVVYTRSGGGSTTFVVNMSAFGV